MGLQSRLLPQEVTGLQFRPTVKIAHFLNLFPHETVRHAFSKSSAGPLGLRAGGSAARRPSAGGDRGAMPRFRCAGTIWFRSPAKYCAAPHLAERVQFVFPAAPLSLDDQGLYGGRAWWPLDVARLAAAIERGELRDQRRHFPAELPEARDGVMELLKILQDETQLPLSRFVLGGFSQGSMIATEVALRLPQSPAALVIWSGTLLCEDVWRELAATHRGLPVLQSHGTADPILPFEAAVWLRDLLQEAGAEVEFIEFYGPHTIPLEAIERTIALLERVVQTHEGP